MTKTAATPRTLGNAAHKGFAFDLLVDGEWVPCRTTRKNAKTVSADVVGGGGRYLRCGKNMLEGTHWREAAPITIDLPQLEVRSKVTRRLSRETDAFTATITVEGKAVAEGENAGHGGSDLWTIVVEDREQARLIRDLTAWAQEIHAPWQEADTCEYLRYWNDGDRQDGVTFKDSLKPTLEQYDKWKREREEREAQAATAASDPAQWKTTASGDLCCTIEVRECRQAGKWVVVKDGEEREITQTEALDLRSALQILL